MPNTLAHIGINGLLSKSLLKSSDVFWIYLGVIIPDIGWIIRKIVFLLIPAINGYDLQAYSIVQGSLLFSVIISFALASLSHKYWKTLIILIVGSILHLLLDSLQIKWANGVHILAPFDWEMISFGLFWPESITTYFLTSFGILYYLIFISKKGITKININLSISSISLFLSFSLLYLLTPFLLLQDVNISDSHYLNTLTSKTKVGKYVEFDRKKIMFNDSTDTFWIESFDTDYFELKNIEQINSARLSIRGYFTSERSINVIEYHENNSIFRDGASYLGLGLLLIFFIISLMKRHKE